MNEISRKPAHTVTELASARQHQENPADHHGARGGGQYQPWGVRFPRRGGGADSTRPAGGGWGRGKREQATCAVSLPSAKPRAMSRANKPQGAASPPKAEMQTSARRGGGAFLGGGLSDRRMGLGGCLNDQREAGVWGILGRWSQRQKNGIGRLPQRGKGGGVSRPRHIAPALGSSTKGEAKMRGQG